MADDLEARVDAQSRDIYAIKASLMEIGQQMEQAHALLTNLLAADALDEGEKGLRHTPSWNCAKCNAVLAKVNTRIGELRVRIKHVNLWSIAGPGGSLALTCPRCGQLNRIVSDDKASFPGVLAGMADSV